MVEGEDEDWAHEVDKRIPHVAVVLQVDWQVEEVIPMGMQRVDLLKQHLLSILIGDVLNHNGGATILTRRDLVQVQLIRLLFSLGNFSHRVSLRLEQVQMVLLLVKT